MTRCEFLPTGNMRGADREFRCRRCGYIAFSPYSEGKIVARCAAGRGMVSNPMEREGPEPSSELRPQAEIDLLKTVCLACPNRRLEIPFWCALDERKASCAKARGNLYMARLSNRGNECQPWQAALAEKQDSTEPVRPGVPPLPGRA